MHSCETHQNLLLELVFDLLEDGERRALQEHLTGCAVCRAALARTQEQQRLLAAAARLEFADVSFVVPAVDPVQLPAAERPIVLQLTRRAPMRWRRWVAAAAVLLAVGIPGLLFGRNILGYFEERRAAERNDAQAQADLRQVIEQAEKENRLAIEQAQVRINLEEEKTSQAAQGLHQVQERREQKIETVRHAQRERQLKLVVTGPGSVQPGAPSEYQIQTFNLNDQPTDAEVWAFVSTQSGEQGNRIDAVPLEEQGRRKSGAYRLTLPADLPLRPDSRPTLLVHAKRDAGAQIELSETLHLVRSAYVTHLATDKPMYQPGETVYFRSLTLDRGTLRPGGDNFNLIYRISNSEVKDRVIAQGSTRLLAEDAVGKKLLPLRGPDGKDVHGVGAGSLPLHAQVTGGEYVLSVEDAAGRFPRQERRFIVNRYQKHVLNKELDFNRKSYGIGDEVQALCKAKDVNGPVKNARVEATVLIDGKTYGADGKENGAPLVFQTDDEGTTTVRFRLPAAIEKGQATLSVTFKDGKVVETMPRSIPIVLKKLQLEFFPEGGDLVAGLPNRIYFQVRTTLGKPADLRGRLLQDDKPLDVVVQTLIDDKEPGVNQGMGRFEFTPKAGSRYAVQVDAPLGIADRHPLPAVKPQGVILSAPEAVVAAGQPIRVTVRTTKPDTLLMVGAYCRGRLLDAVHLEKGQSEVTLKPLSNDGGVCRITVFEETPANANRRELKPVAERLIYRQPVERLRVVLRPDRSNYVPGQPAKMAVEAFDEKDQPAAALVMLAVVDKSVLAMADEKTARTMPTHFLLTTEVRRAEDLEYADFLLEQRPLKVLGLALGMDPRPAAALDLLLGTQGWRRFAEQNPTQFRQNLKDPGDAEAADRLLVSSVQSVHQSRETARERVEIEKVRAEFSGELGALTAKTKQGEQAAQAVRVEANKATAVRAEAARVKGASANETCKTTSARLESYQKDWDDLRGLLFPLLTATLVVAILVCFFLAVASAPRRAVPYYLGMTACTVFIAVLGLNWGPSGETKTTRDEVVAAADINGFADPRKENRQFDRNLDREFELLNGLEQRNAVMEKAAAFPQVPRPGQGDWNFDAKPGEAKKAAAPMAANLAKADDNDKAAFGAEKQQLQLGARALAAKGRPPGAFDGKGEAADGVLADRAKFAGMKDIAEGEHLRQMDQQLGGRGNRMQVLPPLVVREYAHKHDDKANGGLRSDFAETLYWHPVLVLPNGKTDVSFALCDSVTSFQATAFAHTTNGRLGAATVVFDSKLPFTLYPKTPIEVTSGDRIALPVGIANNTGAPRAVDLTLKQHTGLELLNGKVSDQFTVQGETARKHYLFRPLLKQGDAVLTFEGKTNGFAADAVQAKFRIVPEGFPRSGSVSDTLEGSAAVTLKLVEEWIPGTLQAQVQVYPSTLADLQKGLESLLREPGGCFEQTSTSSYPNVLILDYLDSSKQAKPEVEKRARELLGRGYQKLTSFECQNRKAGREGYEWFGGQAPPHEALTAYGLLQFRDMARFQEVDPAMIKRTQDYLLSRRDKKGGFHRNDRALDTFGRAPQHITDAYIVWALSEAGCEDTLKTELDALLAKAKDSKDAYFLSLVANSLINKGRTQDALPLLKTAADAQTTDGHLDGLEMSITSSRGKDLQIETTALAVMGWLKANPGEFNKPVKKAIEWIGKQRGGYGGFGSTQSTILALRALIAFTKNAPRDTKAGVLTLFVGDKPVGTAAFKAGTSDTILLPLPNAEQWLKQGDNKIRIELTGGNVLPFTLSWSYQTKKLANTGACPLVLETEFGQGKTNTTAKEGDVVRLTATLKNTSKDGQGMAVAIIGLPGGMTIPEDMKQLKEFTRLPEDGSRPLIAAFEVRGRELVLYWRDLQGNQKIEVPIDLVCRVPGEYTGPASRAYLYYDAESKNWIDPLSVTIAPAE